VAQSLGHLSSKNNYMKQHKRERQKVLLQLGGLGDRVSRYTNYRDQRIPDTLFRSVLRCGNDKEKGASCPAHGVPSGVFKR
jgi:hypothetical protein